MVPLEPLCSCIEIVLHQLCLPRRMSSRLYRQELVHARETDGLEEHSARRLFCRFYSLFTLLNFWVTGCTSLLNLIR